MNIVGFVSGNPGVSARVNGSRHQFFSGSRLANDQNRGVALADLSDHLHELTHRGGFTDQTAKASLSGQRRAREVHVVLHSFGFLSWGRQGGKIFAKSVSRYNTAEYVERFGLLRSKLCT